jgi:hypothetical protein
MTSPRLHDTPLIPWAQEAAFIEGVTIDESHELGVDELLAHAASSDAAASLAQTASEAGTQRRRQRFAHQAQVYRRLAAERLACA